MRTAARYTGRRVGLVRGAAVAAVAVFAIRNKSTFSIAIGAAGEASPLHIMAGVALSLLAMANRGLLNHAAHHAVGLQPTQTQITRTTAIGFAANKILKSGGISGLAVFVRHGKRHGFPTGQVAAACVIAAVASLVALGVLLTTAVALLAVSGRLTGWWLAASTGFGLYSLALLFIGRSALRSKEALGASWVSAQRLKNRISRRSAPIDVSGVDQLHAALRLAWANKAWTKHVLGHAVLSKALGAAMLLAAAGAAGVPLSVTGAVIIYATALAASFASVIPAGVGVVEASTGAMFLAAGAPVAVTVIAVALYRIFDLWLPLTTGAILGRIELRRPVPPVVTVRRLCAG